MTWRRFSKPLSSAMVMTLLTTTVPVALAHSVSEQSTATESQHGVEVHLHRGYPIHGPWVFPAAAEESTLATHARSSAVMDYATGKVFFEKDAHEKLPMASITKIMTMLLIMEAIDSGKLKLTDKIKTSEYAASMGGSQIFLEAGESMTVQDLLKGIAVASANDACVAMAEHLCGSEGTFVERMNARAKELGMDDTHFVNCNGLPAPNHYSSAHDIAIMSRELLKHEAITKWTSVYSDYLRKDSEHPLWLVNTNKLVRFYQGVDGLKTGYTAEAKYCLAATAQRDKFRVIAVVMGEPNPKTRNAEVTQLLNWSFSNYASTVLYRQGQPVTIVEVPRGFPRKLAVTAGDTVGVVHERGSQVKHHTKANMFNLTPPIKAGQRVGTLQVYQNEDLVAEVPLLAARAIDRAGFFHSLGRTMRDFVTFSPK